MINKLLQNVDLLFTFHIVVIFFRYFTGFWGFGVTVDELGRKMAQVEARWRAQGWAGETRPVSEPR
jgi:hypothetical protein